MNRVRPIVIVAALIAAALQPVGAQRPAPLEAFQSPAPTQAPSIILEKIIVKVNGEIFTQSELEQIQIETLQRDQKKQINSARDLHTDAALAKALLEITPDILSDRIDQLLLVQFGREVGIKFTDEVFKMGMENLKKVNNLDDKQLASAMKEAGITVDQLRQNFERTYMVEQVQRREIMRNLNLTEEEARQYYKAHPEQFMKPPTVTLREILVTVPTDTAAGQTTVNAAKDDAAKEKIEAIRARALKGEDFVALVTETSEAGSKANGGIVGPVLVEELSPAIATALAKLKPGEITEVLRLGNGYRIFKLESRTVAEVEAFDKLRNEIANRIYESRLDAETEKFLKRLRTQALIEWKDDGYKKMYEQAIAKQGKTGL